MVFTTVFHRVCGIQLALIITMNKKMSFPFWESTLKIQGLSSIITSFMTLNLQGHLGAPHAVSSPFFIPINIGWSVCTFCLVTDSSMERCLLTPPSLKVKLYFKCRKTSLKLILWPSRIVAVINITIDIINIMITVLIIISCIVIIAIIIATIVAIVTMFLVKNYQCKFAVSANYFTCCCLAVSNLLWSIAWVDLQLKW